jgi:GrpB-like predicted nucleotidyltransferase (UPF0157 family)
VCPSRWQRAIAAAARSISAPGGNQHLAPTVSVTGLWHPRRVAEGIVVVAYSQEWPTLFAGVGQRLRRELGDVALRAHREHAAKYAALKHSLAKRFAKPAQRHDYVEAKVPFIWDTIHLADEWAQRTGWQPPPSDC